MKQRPAKKEILKNDNLIVLGFRDNLENRSPGTNDHPLIFQQDNAFGFHVAPTEDDGLRYYIVFFFITDEHFHFGQ